MVCLACHTFTSGSLCPACAGTLRPATDRVLAGGLRLVAAFEHQGAAQELMHHLKYRGVLDFADLVVERIAPRVPRLPLVPVPRAISRRLKYGVDPARLIARCLASRLGVPVINVLTPHLHTPRRAGRDHSKPVTPFTVRRVLGGEVMLVDDVVTTGSTVAAAVSALGPQHVRMVLAANSVAKVSSLSAS
ncbi:MAG: ComF family protein [Acidimicrobiia bacterium]